MDTQFLYLYTWNRTHLKKTPFEWQRALNKTLSISNVGKNVEVGPWPPPLPGLDSLTGIFFIVYLALIGHEIDFEQNLYFSLTKVVWHLENFAFFPYVYTIKQSYIAKEMKILSVRPTCLKIKKNILSVYFVFQGILNIF